jgi:P27 family predicted phage terminase small subunit
MLKTAGTFRADRHANKLELPLGAPNPRAAIGEISRDAFEFVAERLTNVGVVSEIDTFALQMFADAWEDYVAAREVIRRDGPTYTTTTNTGDTMFRPRPELAMMNNAWDRLKKIIPEFGMTPSSRAKIDARTRTNTKTRTKRTNYKVFENVYEVSKNQIIWLTSTTIMI